MQTLTSSERKALRGRGHHLDPVVRVGDAGIHPGVIAKIEAELLIHELIKVKVGNWAPMSAKEAAPILVEATGAALVQVIGGMVLLYKERPPEDEDQD
jgi:RNA-binding protein